MSGNSVIISVIGGGNMDLNAENIGKRIKNFRMIRGLTQEQLAESSNRHFTYIGRVERGEKNISVQALNDILNALGVSFKEFFMPFEVFDTSDSLQEIYEDIVIPMMEKDRGQQDRLLRIFKLILEDDK